MHCIRGVSIAYATSCCSVIFFVSLNNHDFTAARKSHVKNVFISSGWYIIRPDDIVIRLDELAYRPDELLYRPDDIKISSHGIRGLPYDLYQPCLMERCFFKKKLRFLSTLKTKIFSFVGICLCSVWYARERPTKTKTTKQAMS